MGSGNKSARWQVTQGDLSAMEPYCLASQHTNSILPLGLSGGLLPALLNHWGKYNDRIQLLLATTQTLATKKNKRKRLA